MCSTLVIQQDHPNYVRLAGELDIAGVRDVEAALTKRDGDVVLDCAGLTFIDAAGLGVIIAMHAAYETRGATLSIVSPAECVVRLLELTGHDAVLNVRTDGSAR